MHPETVGLIINRAPKGELNEGIQEEIANQGLIFSVWFHRMKQFMNMTARTSYKHTSGRQPVTALRARKNLRMRKGASEIFDKSGLIFIGK